MSKDKIGNDVEDEVCLTRSRSDSRQELENYFKSDSFNDLVSKAITQQF
jgi:hypothetical protein